jgi:hypothetical protein
MSAGLKVHYEHMQRLFPVSLCLSSCFSHKQVTSLITDKNKYWKAHTIRRDRTRCNAARGRLWLEPTIERNKGVKAEWAFDLQSHASFVLHCPTTSLFKYLLIILRVCSSQSFYSLQPTEKVCAFFSNIRSLFFEMFVFRF